jgi:uncharacterized integral membrane protein
MKLARKLTLIMLIAVIAVMISYFAKANDRYVTLDLVFVTIENIQIWLLSLFCFLAGIIFSVILVAVDIIMINYRERKLRKENKNLRDEISRIRNSKLAEIDNGAGSGTNNFDTDPSDSL